ncbi:MAG: hypothetical protein ABMA13_15625 [Chthoniobacteraceae bacterium]
MTPRAILSVTIAAIIPVAFTGCESAPGSGEGIYSQGGAAAGSALARGAASSSGEGLVASAAVHNVGMATVVVIAKRQASERQRKVAEERAKAFQAKLTPAKKAAMKKKKVRYVAIDTVKDERTHPKAKKDVMIWDVESQQIVGNNVYDVESTPPIGQTARFETYAAEYVGTGS